MTEEFRPIPGYGSAAQTAIDQIDQMEKMVQTIKPMLASLPPNIQGGVLAELTAIWLWGHQGEEMRRDVFDLQNKAIRNLVELFDAARRVV